MTARLRGARFGFGSVSASGTAGGGADRLVNLQTPGLRLAAEFEFGRVGQRRALVWWDKSGEVKPPRPLVLSNPRGLLVQVGTMCRHHGTGRDSPLEVDIGPGV